MRGQECACANFVSGMRTNLNFWWKGEVRNLQSLHPTKETKLCIIIVEALWVKLCLDDALSSRKLCKPNLTCKIAPNVNIAQPCKITQPTRLPRLFEEQDCLALRTDDFAN